MAILQDGDWFDLMNPDFDFDAESPGHPWECDCADCAAQQEAAAAALARPEELGEVA